MEKTKKIVISIPEGYEIDKEKSTFEKIVFKKKEQTLPKTWKELVRVSGYFVSGCSDVLEIERREANSNHTNIFYSEEQAEAAVALAQLSQLREVYRQGWVPDYKNNKFAIHFLNGDIVVNEFRPYNVFLSFQSKEIRNEFLENFKDLILQAKPLLG